MFYCRRLLSQVRILKPTPKLIVSRGKFLDARSTIPRVLPSTNPSQPSTSTKDLLPQYTTSPTSPPATWERDATTQMETTKLTMEQYETRRAQNRDSVIGLPDNLYLPLLREGFKNGLANFVEQVLQDALQLSSIVRTRLVCATLSMADLTILPPKTISELLGYLSQDPNAFNSLTTSVVERLTRLAVDGSQASTDTPLLHSIHPLLLHHLQCHHVPRGAYSLSYHPPPVIFTSFEYLQILLRHPASQPAFDIFQALIASGHIPPEATHQLDGSSDGFQIIMSSALVRAALHWNWRPLAAKLLVTLLQTNHPPDTILPELAVDVIYACLEVPTPTDIRICRRLVCAIHPMAPVPDGVVRQFYHHASQCNQGEEAEILYAFSRAPNTMNSHMYPPPHGTALVWLMEHLATKSRRTHLSRTLAAEVAENHLPIPLHSRARFLSLTAARGYGTLARVLWERYSTGKDKITVVGNSALMIRMVSLFNHLAQKMAPRKHDRTGNTGPRQHDSEEFVDFTNHILSEYRHCHQPLSNAHHRVLTSLARAYFILGESAEGFNTFKILMERKEIPDIYDVNVALTAMAEHHPRSAARMIQRMIEKGLRPDAVTFGTVMHHALLHNDMDLVADMIARARELKDVRMSLKSVAALVRASVAPNDDNFRANQRAKLEGAMSIVKSLMKPHSISSPQTGKYLVFASLRADEPVMAYRFWKLMVKDSTEWNDREQQFQRRLIAQMIRKHHKRCRLDNNQTLAMLSQLNRASGIK